MLGVLEQAPLNFVAVATLLFFFFCVCPKFCDLAKQRRKIFVGVSEVGKIDFALYFFWLCVFFLVFHFLLLRSRDSLGSCHGDMAKPTPGKTQHHPTPHDTTQNMLQHDATTKRGDATRPKTIQRGTTRRRGQTMPRHVTNGQQGAATQQDMTRGKAPPEPTLCAAALPDCCLLTGYKVHSLCSGLQRASRTQETPKPRATGTPPASPVYGAHAK